MPVSYYLMILVTKILPVKQFVAVVVFKIMSAIDQQLVTNIPLQFVKDKYYKLFLQVKKAMPELSLRFNFIYCGLKWINDF